MAQKKSRLIRTAGRMTALAPAMALVLAFAVGQDAAAPGAAVAAAPALPAPPANGEMGFVLTQFHVKTYIADPKKECPDGFLTVLKDDYLRLQPAAERARLLEPANEAELQRNWQTYGNGPNGTNICTNIREFPDRPPTPMLTGPVAWGFNLDNDVSGSPSDSYTCKHTNFTSPTGEKGVDNQFWRVRGCSVQYRAQDESGNGEHRTGYDDAIMTGEYTQVIRLRGVNSLVNDPDVELLYANTDNRPLTDTNRRPLSGGSYVVSSGGRRLEYRNFARGKIVNGVLETQPFDIQLAGLAGGVDLQRGRVRLEFQPDGTVKGMVGGYMPLLQVMSSARGGGLGSVRTAGINCAGQYTALKMMADGDRDPKTGQCNRISYAFEIVAYPGFVTDAPGFDKGTTKVASK